MRIWTYILIVCFFILLLFFIFVMKNKVEKEQSELNSLMTEKHWGFVMCRHVNQLHVNQYWQECVRNIRRFYPKNKIVIIDDHSYPTYLDKEYEKQLLAKDSNIIIIESEYKGVGELLGYYYFHKHRWFEKAMILHDSVFLNSSLKKKIHDVKDVAFLWSFRTKIYDDNEAIDMYLNLLHNHEKLVVQKKSGKWVGCFGVMTVIRLDFLDRVDKEHRIFDILLPQIKCRENRMVIERVLSIIIHAHMENGRVDSLFGDIHDYCIWGHTYSDYENKKLDDLPMIKIWTGR